METLNNIYMMTTVKERKHIPSEIEKMYEEAYGERSLKKFFRVLKR